ncbi:MAG TPA: HAD-IA family hydrolase [Burkholderiaceae bacterium]|nr:HAD-IA family hydrolase [Burkholderiaceae bacterium]
MRRFDLVVWDWDGTIVDSTAAIADGIMLAAADLGLPVPSPRDARWVIGMGLFEAIHHAVPSIRREQLPAFVERYRVHYLKRDAELATFDGIPELLRGLDVAGVPLAVATGKSRAGLDRALVQTGLGPRFASTRCADEGAPKPDPWMLRDLGETLQVPPGRMVMIGDTTHDVGMAQAAGAASVAVLYGAHDPQTLRASSPDAVVGSVAELADWLAAACEVERSMLGPVGASR